MSKIYQGQTSLKIQLTCEKDVTDAQETKIKYQKPDGDTGSWDASVSDATNGVLYHNISEATELDQTGWWLFWAYVKFADGRDANGEPVQVKVYAVGE